MLCLGKAFSILHTDEGRVVRANGTLSQHIATYRFRVEKDAEYVIWIEALGTSFVDNSVSFHVDEHGRQIAHQNFFDKRPAWVWNYLDEKVYSN